MPWNGLATRRRILRSGIYDGKYATDILSFVAHALTCQFSPDVPDVPHTDADTDGETIEPLVPVVSLVSGHWSLQLLQDVGLRQMRAHTQVSLRMETDILLLW